MASACRNSCVLWVNWSRPLCVHALRCTEAGDPGEHAEAEQGQKSETMQGRQRARRRQRKDIMLQRGGRHGWRAMREFLPKGGANRLPIRDWGGGLGRRNGSYLSARTSFVPPFSTSILTQLERLSMPLSFLAQTATALRAKIEDAVKTVRADGTHDRVEATPSIWDGDKSLVAKALEGSLLELHGEEGWLAVPAERAIVGKDSDDPKATVRPPIQGKSQLSGSWLQEHVASAFLGILSFPDGKAGRRLRV